jgi:EAL domain-containing protein (putative c-di-GMP-specific phosphodiesterase class I)
VSIAESSGLMRALRRLMPDAMLSVSSEKPWYSISFSGTQLSLSAKIAQEHHRETAAELSRILPEHLFDLENWLVAEIAVSDHVNRNNSSSLVIDVLLLDA